MLKKVVASSVNSSIENGKFLNSLFGEKEWQEIFKDEENGSELQETLLSEPLLPQLMNGSKNHETFPLPLQFLPYFSAILIAISLFPENPNLVKEILANVEHYYPGKEEGPLSPIYLALTIGEKYEEAGEKEKAEKAYLLAKSFNPEPGSRLEQYVVSSLEQVQGKKVKGVQAALFVGISESSHTLPQ